MQCRGSTASAALRGGRGTTRRAYCERRCARARPSKCLLACLTATWDLGERCLSARRLLFRTQDSPATRCQSVLQRYRWDFCDPSKHLAVAKTKGDRQPASCLKPDQVSSDANSKSPGMAIQTCLLALLYQHKRNDLFPGLPLATTRD